jgi:hypothetical protein
LGRDFLDTADRLSKLSAESDWRSAASRSYYAVYLECREALIQWGFSFPIRASHLEVSRRFAFPKNNDLNQIAALFQNLSSLRNKADYDLGSSGSFATPSQSTNSVAQGRAAIKLLDSLSADAARRAQAIADIRAAFP